MRQSAILFPIALAAIILVPRGGAQAQDAQEGPIAIEKRQTISQPGSYKLVTNLTFTGTTGVCLQITADFVTIDLAGFTISGPGNPNFTSNETAIAAGNDTTGIVARNGSISGFVVGVDLGGDGSIVEGLRVSQGVLFGIEATGIVRGNTVLHISGFGPGAGTGTSATGTVTGNYASGNRASGIRIGQGSTVIGNTASGNGDGILVDCPSNVTDNTAVGNSFGVNLVLNGTGCNNTNNVAP
jgi:parallel beta-helix repeat protein